MSPTWHSDEAPVAVPLGFSGALRACLRGGVLLSVLLLGVLGTLLLRPLERARDAQARPWTGWVTVWVCRLALRIMGLRVEANGAPMKGDGILVANHSSWLDIFVLNAAAPLYFVSKSEVAGWPGIGWLARLTGTAFVRRDAREAGRQAKILQDRILAGHRLLFFPEGTSTDGQRVLPFKSTLFASVFAVGNKERVSVQPVTVAYDAPEGCDPRYFGWWGDMAFGPHLLRMLAHRGGGRIRVTWHDALVVNAFSDRKALAKEAERAVRSAHPMGAA